MPVSDFSRQVLLSVVDKVLLGGAAVMVGYFVNLRLERFRARHALEGEFLRERTRRLDELYGLMLDTEVAATTFQGIVLGYIEEKKANKLILFRPAGIDPARNTFKQLSERLRRKAAHYGPWIGDELKQHCAEYDQVVRDNVTEQTVAGSHNMEAIERLDKRTRELQELIVAAIREGAPTRSSTKGRNR